MDTIFALASAQGRAGVSVVRLSGPDAFAAAAEFAGPLPAPRRAALRQIRSASGEMIDQGLVLSFQGPGSFTGEDVVELQLHGSIAVVKSVLATLGGYPGLRLADPGEFTRRALENNRLDLAQVEGLADLIDAETEAQRKLALRTLSGALGERVEMWRRDLIRAAALIEATIDFADEEVPEDVTPEVDALLRGVLNDLQSEIKGADAAERLRTGYEVAIVGPPNVGKSTFLNRLAGREAALTSEIAGTTRDVIEVRLDLGGLAVTFLDTAGLRETADMVEGQGISRALERAEQADIRVVLGLGTSDSALKVREDDIFLAPKVDLVQDSRPGISGLTGAGVTEFLEELKQRLSHRAASASLLSHARQERAVFRAERYISAASDLLRQGPSNYDTVAEELRSAVRALESLVGRIGVDDLLDEIFSSFCLGK